MCGTLLENTDINYIWKIATGLAINHRKVKHFEDLELGGKLKARGLPVSMRIIRKTFRADREDSQTYLEVVECCGRVPVSQRYLLKWISTQGNDSRLTWGTRLYLERFVLLFNRIRINTSRHTACWLNILIVTWAKQGNECHLSYRFRSTYRPTYQSICRSIVDRHSTDVSIEHRPTYWPTYVDRVPYTVWQKK